MSDGDPDVIPISALNQYVFCPRRCALMYVEGMWSDNEHTVIGSLLHDKADKPGYEMEEETLIIRALPLFSRRYGLSGKADIVEFHNKVPLPVEYKKSKKQKWGNDDVQLCAQALCLEEMFQTGVQKGYLYHAGSKRRREVHFNENLRKMTIKIINEVRKLLNTRQNPPAVLAPKCEGCSLHSVCLPELTQKERLNVQEKYLRSIWET